MVENEADDDEEELLVWLLDVAAADWGDTKSEVVGRYLLTEADVVVVDEEDVVDRDK